MPVERALFNLPMTHCAISCVRVERYTSDPTCVYFTTYRYGHFSSSVIITLSEANTILERMSFMAVD